MPPSSTLATRICFPELETLEIKDCPELERVPSLCLKSLKHLKLNFVGLNSLKVVGMNEMVSQSEELLDCINLQTLEIIDCRKVKWIQIEDATQLTRVKLSRCMVCKKLPSVGQLPKLTKLELEKFDEVECIGGELYGDSKNMISDRKVYFPELRELHIIGFERLTSWMGPCLGVGTSVLPKLESLEIYRCRLLEMVPALQLESLKKDVKMENVGGSKALDIIGSNCISLQKLDISKCKKVERIPGGMISLKQLWVWDCPSVGSIEEDVLRGLSSLRELTIGSCWGLKRMPKSLEDCTSLEELRIAHCPSIQVEEEEEADIGKLRGGLTSLTLENAGGMMAYLPRWIPQLDRLNDLRITGWGEEWDMSLTSTLPFLTTLTLREFPNMKPLEPECQHLLPPFLKYLEIAEFEEMEALPDWLGGLSSLQELHLWNCKKLKYLPSKPAISRLTRLTELKIVRCPELEERCDKYKKNGPKSLIFPEF